MGASDIEVVKINDHKDQSQSDYLPHEREVVDSVIALWKEDPTTESLGVRELFTLVNSRHANWKLCEDDVKKHLQKFGLMPNTLTEQFSYAEEILSKETPHISLPDSVKLVMTSDRGKGLFVRKPIPKGHLIWEEPPLFLVPLLSHFELINIGKACAYCGKIGNDTSRSMSGISVLRGLDCNVCLEIWCSIACKRLDKVRHAALKHGSKATIKRVDPERFHKFAQYCIDEQWNALYAIAIIYADIILDKSQKKWEQFNAMARVSQKTRYRALNLSAGAFDSMQGGALFVEEQQDSLWEKGYEMFKGVFPMASADGISYNEFLLMMGSYNINNLDSSVYLLQSHLNHNCAPNVHVETSLKKHEGLKVYANRDLNVGEELTTSYVNPSHTTKQRQRELRVNWGFICNCDRCEREVNSLERRKSSIIEQPQQREDIKKMLQNISDELVEGKELDIPLDYNGERRKSVRFDETVVKVT